MNAWIKILDRRLRGFAVPALIVVLCLVLIVLAALNLTALFALNTKIHAEQTLLRTNIARKEALMRLSQNEEENRALLEEYRELLTGGENQSEVFSRVEALSREYAVSVSQISFGEVQTQDALRKLSLQLTINGAYPQLMAMLEEFSYGGRLTTLDTLSLSQNTGENTVRAHVRASIFFE